MYKTFRAQNFRCFRDLPLEVLDRVNLVAGLNNVGKTALLEGLFLHCGAYGTDLTLRLNYFRGLETAKIEFGPMGETPWDSLFTAFDTSQEVTLAGDVDSAGQSEVHLRLLSDPDELAKVGPTVEPRPDDQAGARASSEATKVLQLRYTKGDLSREYYIILGPEGARSTPNPPPPFPTIFLPARFRIPAAADAERFSNLERAAQHGLLLPALTAVDPRLKALTILVSGGVPAIHADVGLGRLVPLPLMGEGMARLASLMVAIGNAPHGVVLVDEIENGLHHSAMPKVWQTVGEAARLFDTQVFATTHSRECIAAAHTAFLEGEPYDFRLYRLERIDGDIRAVTYDRDSLQAALDEELEVR